ncbi:MAG TPA: hypothetical protein VGR37_16405 [Longimicrobiaceae bacterium]|nr:hypothetical protein [Longimicrobiaceae bacterium]
MKHELIEQEDRSASYADERGVGARAGVFLLDGRYHVANQASRAERRLTEMGALRVATLVFDAGEARREVSGGATRPYAFSAPARITPLAPLAPRQALAGLPAPPSRN